MKSITLWQDDPLFNINESPFPPHSDTYCPIVQLYILPKHCTDVRPAILIIFNFFEFVFLWSHRKLLVMKKLYWNVKIPNKKFPALKTTIFDQFFDIFINKNGQFSGHFGMNKTWTIKKFIKNWAKKIGSPVVSSC